MWLRSDLRYSTINYHIIYTEEIICLHLAVNFWLQHFTQNNAKFSCSEVQLVHVKKFSALVNFAKYLCKFGSYVQYFLTLQSGNFHYKTVPSAFKHIWSNEGVKGIYSWLTLLLVQFLHSIIKICLWFLTCNLGLYRGIFSTIIRDAPFSGAYLMFYSKIKTVTKQSKQH